MSTSVSPLNNPPGPGGGVVRVYKSKRTTTTTREVGGQESPRTQGGGGSPGCALVSCATCGELQNIVFALPTPHQWHKCQGCGELLPTDSYRVFIYGWPPVANPARLKAQQHREPAWRR